MNRERVLMLRWRLTFACLVPLLALHASLDAMVVVPAEFGEMVAASQTIVHGRVIDVQSYETAGRRTIESLVTVQVVEAIKGQPGSTAYFKLPGGQVGRYRRVMVGAPQCAPGDEVVLFLKGSAPAVPMPFGLTQGVYRVHRDAAGRATVMPMVATGTERIVRGDASRRAPDLAAFTGMVRTV
ncbi:MAG TPA: hypothetical protein VFS23_02085, partial [Vicinamibacterales bacterium]|nr:hypothetical protein [Vicinamibacterales bacterium]